MMPGARIESARLRVLLLTMLSGASLLFPACGGRPFDVRPATESPIPAEQGDPVETDQARVVASIVRDEDRIYDTFDANLIMAGVLPVQIEISNTGDSVLELRRVRSEVRLDSGKRFNSLDARRAFRRLVKYYGVSTYSRLGYQESLAAFSSHGIKLGPPLAPGESRSGLMFFSIPDELIRSEQLTLVLQRLHSSLARKDFAVGVRLN